MFQTGGIPFANKLGGGGFGKAGRGAGWNGPGAEKGFRAEVDERAANDWFCPQCRERNFQRRVECFKCGGARPGDGSAEAARVPAPARLEVGATMNGMVKSYNRKGFGFLMILGGGHQDMYYTRDNLSPNLETCDIPGRYVTFEIHKMPDGRRTAVSIRPMGEAKPERPSFFCSRPPAFASAATSKVFSGSYSSPSGFRDGGDEATEAAGRASDAASRAGRALSPHAGSRAYAMSAMAGRARSRSSSRKRSSKRRGRASSSSSSSRKSRSSSSSHSKKRKKRKSKRRKRSSSSSRSKSSSCVIEVNTAAPAPTANPEVDKAKAEALAEMLRLRDIPAKDARMSEWRALLRKWHPDKNPDRVEVATTVFQFLQRGKPMLEGS